MKVLLFSEYLKTIHNKEYEPAVICEITSIGKFPRGLISIEGKLARCCSFNTDKDFLTIEYADELIDEDEIFQNEEIKCPYCGIEQSDSWDCEDEGYITCDSCYSEYTYERVVEVSYTSNIKKKNKNFTVFKTINSN